MLQDYFMQIIENLFQWESFKRSLGEKKRDSLCYKMKLSFLFKRGCWWWEGGERVLRGWRLLGVGGWGKWVVGMYQEDTHHRAATSDLNFNHLICGYYPLQMESVGYLQVFKSQISEGADNDDRPGVNECGKRFPSNVFPNLLAPHPCSMKLATVMKQTLL